MTRAVSAFFLVTMLSVWPAAAGRAQQAETFAPGIARMGPGITAPVPLKRPNPTYTAEARRANIEGEIGLDIVVNGNGTVGDVRVTRSLDRVFGLDQAAIDAVKQWRFRPALRDGQAIPVVVTTTMSFDLGLWRWTPPLNPLRPWPDGVIYPAGQANEQFMKDAVDGAAAGATPPVPRFVPAPVYTSAALRSKIEGDVIVEAVVERNGNVSRIRLKKGLHPDLDKNALQAAFDYRFVPGSGTFNGEPARVMIPIVVQFRVR